MIPHESARHPRQTEFETSTRPPRPMLPICGMQCPRIYENTGIAGDEAFRRVLCPQRGGVKHPEKPVIPSGEGGVHPSFFRSARNGIVK